MLIQTPRTVLRHLTDKDFDALYCLTSDADSLKYMGDGKPVSAENTRRWIEVSKSNYVKQGYGNLAVIDKDTGVFAGFGGFVRSPDVPRADEAELIYALLPAYRGQGLATEIVVALLAYGFARLGFARVLATIDPANTPSIRIVEKLGFILTETKTDEHGLETLFYWLNAPER